MRLNISGSSDQIKERLKKMVSFGQASQDKLDKNELEFLPAALEIVETPPSPIGRATAYILISLFLIAVLWACI